jgi:superfamily II DNA or RNA helicase
MPVQIHFSDGTLMLQSLAVPEDLQEPVAALGVVKDSRVNAHRAPAHAYAPLIRLLHGRVPYEDHAQAYDKLHITENEPRLLRPYQQDALTAWDQAQRAGVVVLPTGAGKSYVAMKAILAVQRSALVVAPTIELVHQWAEEMAQRFGQPIGRYGGGDKDLQAITVSTYDSAALIMPYHGDKFGLLICDECHHLPAQMNQRIALQSIAPYRLGLTATPERTDGGEALLTELLGPEVFRTHIDVLEGSFLASYQAEVLEVELDEAEAEAYAEHRSVYTDFIRQNHINFSRPDGWQQFIATAARDPRGRQVLASYREQKRLARSSRAKLRAVWQLLCDHVGERCLVFTDDNATAYTIGSEMFLPVLTHQTKAAERRQMLEFFKSGALPVLVTSKVLNEGVDVPEASVGIIVSGSGSVREHVQRLGRILRPSQGKVAVLYELIAAGTAEAYTGERRRKHRAFGETSLLEQDSC